MSSFTSLVNVDADTAPKLAEFIAAQYADASTAAAFTTECEKLIASSSYNALVLKFIEQNELILSLENEGDIEGYFQAIVSITLFENSAGGEIQENLPVIQKAVDALTSKNDLKPKLRLRILIAIFNMSFSSQSKHFLLCAILKYANATGQTGLVYSYHTRIVEWVTEWGLPDVDKRNLYLLVSEVLENAKESSLALTYFVLYLSTFGKDTALPAEAHTLAITAVKSAIKSPVPLFGDRSTLLESFTQQQVTGVLGSLVDLLRIVCCDTLSAYKAYESKNKAFMVEHGISAEETTTKMRLLTLCSLGVQSQTLQYRQISSALEIADDDVELWVVEAIASGLLEANMDQFQQVVTITRCAHRSFGREHWLGVRAKLADLHKKVQAVLISVEGEKQA